MKSSVSWSRDGEEKRLDEAFALDSSPGGHSLPPPQPYHKHFPSPGLHCLIFPNEHIQAKEVLRVKVFIAIAFMFPQFGKLLIIPVVWLQK